MIPLDLKRLSDIAPTEDCQLSVQRQDGRGQKVALVVPSCTGKIFIKTIDSFLFFFFLMLERM